MTSTETKADPYRDLSADQKARVEKALAKAKGKASEPQQDSPNGLTVTTDEQIIEGEVVGEIVASRIEPVRRSRAAKAKLRERNNHYQVCEPLAADDMEALRSSMLASGIMVPVIVDPNGVVLDGHNRVIVAVDNDLPIPTVVVDLQTDAEKRALAWELNRARRQMTEEQKNELRYQLVVVEGRSPAEVAKKLGESHNTTIRRARKEAAARAATETDSPVGQDDLGAVLPSERKRQKVSDAIAAEPGKSDHQIARETGASQPTVSRTRKKLSEGKQVITKTRTKKLTVHEEFARAVVKLSKAADEIVRLSKDSRAARSGPKLWETNGQELVAILNKMNEVATKLGGGRNGAKK